MKFLLWSYEMFIFKLESLLPAWLIILLAILIVAMVCGYAIVRIMKKILEFSREQKKQLGTLQDKIAFWEALMIAMVLLLISLVDLILSINDNFSLLIAMIVAIFCGWLLTKASIKIGIKVDEGYYLKYHRLTKEEKSITMEFIKPWAEIKTVEIK